MNSPFLPSSMITLITLHTDIFFYETCANLYTFPVQIVLKLVNFIGHVRVKTLTEIICLFFSLHNLENTIFSQFCGDSNVVYNQADPSVKTFRIDRNKNVMFGLCKCYRSGDLV